MLSEHLFFVTERITDILELDEEKESKRILSFPSKIKRKQRITKSLHELHEELSRLVVYLRHVEQGSDEQQLDLDRLYLELRVIADSSDDILNHFFSNDVYDRVKKILISVVGNDMTSDLYHLVNRIRNSHHLLPSGLTYNINTGGNTNLSGQQIIGSTNVYVDHSHSRAPMINRISRAKTYGEYPDSDLVGFQHEIQTLLDYLTQDNKTHVLGIVGMGGLGKTTLAKHIYHHPKCEKKFIHKVWVCISESWDKTSILEEICRQVIPEATKMDYEQAICSLSEQLRSQSYLVVLDDMWSINAWYDISRAFLPWSSGSKVVVTSRNIAVPQHFDGNVHIVEPKSLDDKESWELFRKKAFMSQKISDMLLQPGEKMVKECEGLPLAIVALAGVLGIDKRPYYWERVSKALTHNILKEKNQSTQGVVKEVLAFSYRELPHHLKQCVLYLRLFPEDYEINVRKLTEMWIAEGLISTNEKYTAEEYLDEIVQRHIVKVVETNFMGQVVRIRIHDMIRQMIVDIDKERGFLRDSLRLGASSTTIYGDVQNCNFSSMSQSESIVNVERVFLSKTSSHIRSLIFDKYSRLSQSVLQSMFVKFRLLRVLVLENISIIPEEIGNLIHLRYFELTGFVKHFPEFIGNLRNLQTLNIRRLAWVGEAKMNLCKLKELRHLYLPIYFLRFIDMEKLKLERLEKLKTLWNVRGGEWMLLGMIGLSVVLEELCVQRISTEEQLNVVFRTPSITSYNLQTLELDWFQRNNFDLKLRKMNILRECKSIKMLKLSGKIEAYTDLILPPNLIKLEMRDTYLEEREVMNIISQSCPHLEILNFSSNALMGELKCNANCFPKLVKLTLANLAYLSQWIIESTAMPSLHYLTISWCQNLTLTPEGRTRILQIPQLTIQECRHLDYEPRRSEM